jgi:hypothetical protein
LLPTPTVFLGKRLSRLNLGRDPRGGKHRFFILPSFFRNGDFPPLLSEKRITGDADAAEGRVVLLVIAVE